MNDANRRTWWKGLLVGQSEHQELLDDFSQGVRARSVDQVGWGLIQRSSGLAVASGAPDLNVNIGPARMVTPDGFQVQWTSSQVIDASTATAGSLLGTTAATTVGTKVFIVVAVAHKYTDQNAVVDEDTATQYEDQISGPEFWVWRSAEVPAAEVWYTSTVLQALVSSIIAANHAPVSLVWRNQGDTTIPQSQMREIPRTLQAYGQQTDYSRQLLQSLVSTGLLPMTLNTAGTVSASPVAVGGAAGKITMPGGEQIAFVLEGTTGHPNLYSGDTFKNSVYVATVPVNQEVSFPATNTQYIVRAYLDPEDLSINFYYATGTYPSNARVGNNTHGVDGSTLGGFPATWIDVPLFIVDTQGTGVAPVITRVIANDWGARVRALGGELSEEYLIDQQPYLTEIIGATPMAVASGLDVDIAEMHFMGGLRLFLTMKSATITLTDDALCIIYADTSVLDPVPTHMDVSTGGGVSANRQMVILGIAKTAGGAVTRLEFMPTMRNHLSLDTISKDYNYSVSPAGLVTVSPIAGRSQVVQYTVSGVTSLRPTRADTVFRNLQYYQLDATTAANWEGGSVGAVDSLHYIYADPGGTETTGVNYVPLILSDTAPVFGGRHPSKRNLLCIGSFYQDTANFFYQKSSARETFFPPTLVTAAPIASASYTKVPLRHFSTSADLIPPFATHVDIRILADPDNLVAGNYTAYIASDLTAQVDVLLFDWRRDSQVTPLLQLQKDVRIPIQRDVAVSGDPATIYVKTDGTLPVSIQVRGYVYDVSHPLSLEDAVEDALVTVV